MRKTIYHILNKCLLVIMALQLMNMSFNNPSNFFYDNNPLAALNENRIDCAAEYITEHLLGWDNYFPEKHTSRQSSHFHKTANICWYSEQICTEIENEHHGSLNKYPLMICQVSNGHPADINPPPPKTVA